MMSDEVYHAKVYGFGEIYEEISVNRKLRHITIKYGRPMKVLVLSKCGDYNIRLSEEKARKLKGQFLEFVPCDNPIWDCYFANGSLPVDKHRPPFLLDVFRLIFYVLCPLMEWKRNPNLAHCKIGVLGYRAPNCQNSLVVAPHPP